MPNDAGGVPFAPGANERSGNNIDTSRFARARENHAVDARRGSEDALFERIVGRLAALADDPQPQGAEKLVGLEAYRLRIGDYGVVYEIDDGVRVAIVTRVRRRREVYRGPRRRETCRALGSIGIIL